MVNKLLRAFFKTIAALSYYSMTLLIPKKKELWVFGSWKGKSYSDNSRALFEYVCKNKKNIKAVWISKNKDIYNTLKELGLPTVLYDSFIGKLLVARAAINIQTESNQDTGYYRVGGTKVIQLFHGAGGVKEPFVYGGMNWFKKKLVKIYADNHTTSYWMVASEYYAKRYPVLYECDPNKIIVTGQPRTDVLLGDKSIEYFDKLIKNNPTIKLILYTPTHRNYAQNNLVHFNDESWFLINRFLKEHNYLLFFKPHPLELHKYILTFKTYSNIILLTDKTVPESSDLNEYMHYFDMLISDYSSISTDYLLFNRPIIHYMYDRDTFEDSHFRLNAIDKFVGGPIVKNLKELLNEIENGLNNDPYKDRRYKSIRNAYKFIDTKNCERIYNSIIKLLEK